MPVVAHGLPIVRSLERGEAALAELRHRFSIFGDPSFAATSGLGEINLFDLFHEGTILVVETNGDGRGTMLLSTLVEQIGQYVAFQARAERVGYERVAVYVVDAKFPDRAAVLADWSYRGLDVRADWGVQRPHDATSVEAAEAAFARERHLSAVVPSPRLRSSPLQFHLPVGWTTYLSLLGEIQDATVNQFSCR
jgi:hypothetical protein